MTTRILIADDHPVVRQGLVQILQDEFSELVIGEAEDTGALIEKALAEDWDLVISDLAMPGGGGYEALKAVNKIKPELAIIIVSTYPADQYAPRVLKAGARAFVSKDSLPTDLLIAVREIIAGGKAL